MTPPIGPTRGSLDHAISNSVSAAVRVRPHRYFAAKLLQLHRRNERCFRRRGSRPEDSEHTSCQLPQSHDCR